MALRELVIAVGFQIDGHPLVQANQATDALRDNVLAAGVDATQLGANLQAAGAMSTASLGAATASVAQLGATTTEAGNSIASGMAAAAAGSGQLGAAVDAVQGPFARFRQAAGEALDELKAKYAEHRDEIEKIGKTLKENRGVIAGVFAATAGTIGFSVRTAADFEHAMARVGALIRANDEEMAILSRTARELGASTVFSASQAAEGMSYLAMAGFSVQEIVEAMPGLLDTAAAAQSGLGVTADIVSNILSGFQLEARETGRVADVLTATFTSSNTTLESLGATMSYVAPVASSLGLSIEEVAAMTGRLGDVGIQGERAGTALRAIFTRLAAPTGEAAKILQRLGVVTTDSAGNLLPMIDIIRQIEDRTRDMGSAQRSAILTTLVGVEAVSAFSALLDKGADSIATYADQLRKSVGVAQETAARQMATLKGALEELGGAFEEAQISIGSAFIPVIRLGARILTGVVNLFNALPAPIKTTIAVGIGMIGMLSGLALAASFIIPQLANLSKLMQLTRMGFLAVGKAVPWLSAAFAKLGVTINASMWPITLTIAAIVAGVLILQDVFTYLRGGGDTLTGRVIAWGKVWIDRFAQPIRAAITYVADVFGRIVTGIRNMGNVLGGIVERVKTWIVTGFQAGLDWLLGLPGRTLSALTEWLGQIQAWFDGSFIGGIRDRIISGFQLGLDWIVGLPERTLGVLGEWWDRIRDWFSNVFNIGELLSNVFQRALDLIPAPIRALAETIMSYFPRSPADVGPLSELDKVGDGLVGTVAASIAATDVSPLTDALGQLQSDVDMSALQQEPVAAAPYGRNVAPNAFYHVELNVQVNASGATVEDAQAIGQTTADRIREVLEELVLMDYHSVVVANG